MSFGIPVRNGLALGLTPSTTLSSGRTGPRPALTLNFLTSTALSSNVTFSRGSNATLTDSTGKITYAPANLLRESQTFATSPWAGSIGGTGISPTVTADAGTAPDGTATADRIQFNLGGGTTTSDITRLRQALTLASTPLIFSIYVRSYDGVSSYTMHLVGPTGATTNVTVTGSWQRLYVLATSVTVSVDYAIGLRGGQTPANSNTADILVWGAQLEPVTYQTTPSTYQATTSTAYYGPRFDYDPVTLAPKGLLIEEQRTNLLTASEDFAGWAASSVTVAANTTVAPDGQTSADTLTASTTSGYVARTAAFTGDGDKSYSLFVKAGTSTTTRLALRDTTVSTNRGSVDITWTAGVPSGVAGFGTLQGIDNFGNGWYRIRMLATGVVAANTNQFRFSPDISAGTGTAIFWGAQTENGAFATSYIPTVASTVSRSADVATMTGSNFSAWYNQAQGTFVVGADAVVPTITNVYRSASANDGTANNRIDLFVYNGRWGGTAQVGGVSQADLQISASYTSNTPAKTAFAYNTNDFAVSVAGSAVSTDTSGTIPTVDRLYIGSQTSSGQLNGHIRTLTYYNTRLPNAQLQSLTA